MFANWMKNNNEIVQDIWFSDEAHFYLNAIVTERNTCYWDSENPTFTMKRLYMV